MQISQEAGIVLGSLSRSWKYLVSDAVFDFVRIWFRAYEGSQAIYICLSENFAGTDSQIPDFAGTDFEIPV